MKRNFHIHIFLLLLSSVTIINCDPVFEPMQVNDRYFFSLYGYLDASADTNWVRITPVRDHLFPESEEIDAVVTLTNLATGEREVMKDSVVYYGEGTSAHNFWTTMDIEPAQTYRITARNSRSDSSYVDVELPEDFPVPKVVAADFFLSSHAVWIYIEGVEHLADVRTFHRIRRMPSEREQVFSFSHLQSLRDPELTPGEYHIWFRPTSITRELNQVITDRYFFVHHQAFIASAGPDWHDFSEMDENVYALPDGISNVENGVGYVAGIVSKTVPLRSCYSETNEHIPCPLEKPMRDP